MLRGNEFGRTSRFRLPHAGWPERRANAIRRSRANFSRQRATETHSAAAEVLLRNLAKQIEVGRSVIQARTSPRSKSLTVSRFLMIRTFLPSTKTSAGRHRAL